MKGLKGERGVSYTAILIPFDLLLRLTATESALINEVRKLFLHEVVDHGDGLLKAILVCACDVEIERGALK